MAQGRCPYGLARLGDSDLGRACLALPLQPRAIRSPSHGRAPAPGRGGRSLSSAPDQHDRLTAGWHRVREVFLELGFGDVVLDPHGYRRGGLLTVLANTGG